MNKISNRKNVIGGLIVTPKSNSKGNTLLVGMNPLNNPVLSMSFVLIRANHINHIQMEQMIHQLGQTRDQKGAEGQCGTTSIRQFWACLKNPRY